MTTYDVKVFDTHKAKNLDSDLATFLNELAGDGWTVVSVVAAESKGKGLSVTAQRVDSLLVIVSR